MARGAIFYCSDKINTMMSFKCQSSFADKMVRTLVFLEVQYANLRIRLHKVRP